MTTRPIIFSGPMVLAILDGRKTQTRRIIVPKHGGVITGPASDGGAIEAFGGGAWHEASRMEVRRCPHQPGDKLWVREKFRIGTERIGDDEYAQLIYCADDEPIEIDGSEIDMGRLKLGKTYPSIHMPKWAARIWLEITEVRVERVQDISEEDAKAEGLIYDGAWWLGGIHPVKKTPLCWPYARYAFAALWDSIHGKDAWDRNDWVFAYSFERTEKP